MVSDARDRIVSDQQAPHDHTRGPDVSINLLAEVPILNAIEVEKMVERMKRTQQVHTGYGTPLVPSTTVSLPRS